MLRHACCGCSSKSGNSNLIVAAAEYSVREQRGWYLYDWANSAFVTTGVALFLGPYLTALAKAAADANGLVHPLGIGIDARSYWSYLVSLSVILQVLVLPVVGAAADYGHRKKQYLAVTAYVGAAAATAMFWLQGDEYLWGGALFILANVSFGASVVVYNSFLPEIAPPEQRDAVSSKGWGIGYIGGGVLLALNLLLYLNAKRIGITDAMAVRISLGSAGVWWAVFTIPTLLTLRNRSLPGGQRAVAGAVFGQLRHTLADIRRYPQTMMFLIAYLLYNDAIQAVLALASQFGNDELKIPVSSLTLAILMVQFVLPSLLRGDRIPMAGCGHGCKTRHRGEPSVVDGNVDLSVQVGLQHSRLFHCRRDRGDCDGREPGAQPFALRPTDSSGERGRVFQQHL